MKLNSILDGWFGVKSISTQLVIMLAIGMRAARILAARLVSSTPPSCLDRNVRRQRVGELASAPVLARGFQTDTFSLVARPTSLASSAAFRYRTIASDLLFNIV